VALAQGTLMYQDNTPGLPVGAVRGFKVGFGYSNKGTICSVYVVAANNGATTNVREVPLLANGKADTNAVAAYLQSFGVVLTNAVKQVIGA
jgi:hypothetical protein